MFADERMKLATHVRYLPVGCFTAGNLGKITSVLSDDMVFVEEQSIDVLSLVTSDVFAQTVIMPFMFWLHPVIGCAALATVVVAVVVAQFMNRGALRESADRQQATSELCRNKTTIVIAHHLSTIASADKILALDSGRVAETGSHEELIAHDSVCAKMVAAELAAGAWVKQHQAAKRRRRQRAKRR